MYIRCFQSGKITQVINSLKPMIAAHSSMYVDAVRTPGLQEIRHNTREITQDRILGKYPRNLQINHMKVNSPAWIFYFSHWAAPQMEYVLAQLHHSSCWRNYPSSAIYPNGPGKSIWQSSRHQTWQRADWLRVRNPINTKISHERSVSRIKQLWWLRQKHC